MPCPVHIQITVLRTLLFQVCVHNFFRLVCTQLYRESFSHFYRNVFVIISISIYIFGIYLILVLSNCNAIQSTDCHVRYFNKLSIYHKLSIILTNQRKKNLQKYSSNNHDGRGESVDGWSTKSAYTKSSDFLYEILIVFTSGIITVYLHS